MHDVAIAVAIGGILVVGALGALVPLALPWPDRVRWMVAARAGDPFDPAGPTRHGLDLREVAIESVEARIHDVALVVVERGRPADAPVRLVGPRPGDDLLALVRDWGALGTPLLLWIDGRGGAALHGPTEALADLVVASVPTVARGAW